MLPKVEACRDCPAFTHPPGFCEPVGSGVNGVLIVGPHADEAGIQQGNAITQYSEAGTILHRACDISEMSLDQFTYTNLLQCGASHRREVLNHCSIMHLRPLVERLKPRMIVALGSEVALELTGLTGNKTDTRYVRGFIMDGINAASGYPVKLTYDPLVVREGNMNLLGALAHDLLQARTQTRIPFRPRYKVGMEHATEWLRRARECVGLPISYDIETGHTLKSDEDEVRGHNDAITQIQFSLGVNNDALILPWTERARDFTKVVMSLPHIKLSWNGLLFDRPRLEKEGVVFNGVEYDLMWLWHFLETGLPYNLSHCAGHFLGDRLPPWKHTMTADLHRYGGLDVDSLSQLYEPLMQRLDNEGMADAYETFIMEFWPVLADMSRRGFPFSKERAEELADWIGQESGRIFEQIQAGIPNSLKNCHPKEGYKKKPKPLANKFEERDDGMYCWDNDYQYWSKLETRKFGEDERWVRIKPFLVTSSDQVKRYAAAKGHKLYKVKTGHVWKESTGKKELLKMAVKYEDQFYKTAVEYRELDKIASTYLSWPADEHGRVHAEFHMGPESGQIDTRQPNVNNMPKGTALAKKIRSCVVAARGHKLIEIDCKGFHAKTLGYCARDITYMTLAAEDIHSYLGWHILNLPGADELMELEPGERIEKLEWFAKTHRDVRNKKAKPCMHGLGFGMGVQKLYVMNEDKFESLAEAKRIHGIVKAKFPKIFAWQAEIRNLAHAQRKLVTEFGCVRRFYDIFRWDYVRGCWRPGDQAEECIAFPPSNLAHCHIKLAMMRMNSKGWLDRYNLVNFIKDSLVFECPNILVDECIDNVRSELEAPSSVLVDPEVAPTGFWVGADVELGNDWGLMEAYGHG